MNWDVSGIPFIVLTTVVNFGYGMFMGWFGRILHKRKNIYYPEQAWQYGTFAFVLSLGMWVIRSFNGIVLVGHAPFFDLLPYTWAVAVALGLTFTYGYNKASFNRTCNRIKRK